MNVALYGRGAKRWAMTERGRKALSRTPGAILVGPSSMAWDGTALALEIDEIAVPLPRRLRGRIVLRPEALTAHAFELDPEGRHRWWPVAPSARIEVAFEKPALAWQGRAYFDTNEGAEPLERGFLSWNWSRAHLGRDTAILYDTLPRQGGERGLALRFDTAGALERFEPPPQQALPPGLWRVARATRAERPARPRVIETLEDAPFYTRSLIATRLLGQDATAVHESLSLRRFETAWVKTLLPFRMPRALA